MHRFYDSDVPYYIKEGMVRVRHDLQTQPLPSRMLTPEEAAERLSVSPTTIRKWLRSGKLQGYKLPSVWRIRESDLEKFILEGKQ